MVEIWTILKRLERCLSCLNFLLRNTKSRTVLAKSRMKFMRVDINREFLGCRSVPRSKHRHACS